MKINKRDLNNKMVWLGFKETNLGTAMIRYAVTYYEPGMSLTKELYPRVGKEFGTTAERAERDMRHALDLAWDRGDGTTIEACFGYMLKAGQRPTLGHFIGRMGVLCSED